jgi:hypothetical protein
MNSCHLFFSFSPGLALVLSTQHRIAQRMYRRNPTLSPRHDRVLVYMLGAFVGRMSAGVRRKIVRYLQSAFKPDHLGSLILDHSASGSEVG